MVPPVRFGVCGIGRIGHQHCRVFAANPEHYRLVALCDQDLGRALAVQADGGGRAYASLDEFLADPELELVIIATRSLDHTRQAAQALAAGKSVLLEKPIGVTAADYQQLRQLVSAYPGRLFFGHNHRFEPAFENMREIAASGILGNILVVKITRHHPFMRRNDWQMRLDCGGGQLSVWGPHLIDQGLRWLDSPVQNVTSFLRRHLTPGDADDYARITLAGENARLVELEISCSAALPAPYCLVYGDRGTLQCSADQRELQVRHLPPDFRWPPTTASTATPAPGQRLHADPELPWISEQCRVTPDISLWEAVEIALAGHLFAALRQQIPFPIRSEEALEVVRISEIVKRQNPQFAWIG